MDDYYIVTAHEDGIPVVATLSGAGIGAGIDASVDIDTIVARLTSIRDGALTQPQVTAAINNSADIDTIVTLLGSINTLTANGLAYRSTATGTRLANTTAYAINDVYGGVIELSNIGAAGGFILLNSLRIIFNLSAVPSGMRNFTIYLYDAPPPSAVTDNGSFSIPVGDRPSCLTPTGLAGSAVLAQGGGSVVMQISDINRVIKLANGSTSLWAYVVTSAAFTPAAPNETFSIISLALGV
jgi:hypothetical protein